MDPLKCLLYALKIHISEEHIRETRVLGHIVSIQTPLGCLESQGGLFLHSIKADCCLKGAEQAPRNHLKLF